MNAAACVDLDMEYLPASSQAYCPIRASIPTSTNSDLGFRVRAYSGSLAPPVIPPVHEDGYEDLYTLNQIDYGNDSQMRLQGFEFKQAVTKCWSWFSVLHVHPDIVLFLCGHCLGALAGLKMRPPKKCLNRSYSTVASLKVCLSSVWDCEY